MWMWFAGVLLFLGKWKWEPARVSWFLRMWVLAVMWRLMETSWWCEKDDVKECGGLQIEGDIAKRAWVEEGAVLWLCCGKIRGDGSYGENAGFGLRNIVGTCVLLS